MNFNVKYGTDLILLIDVSVGEDGSEFKAVAHATSHSLEFSRNIRDISSKSTGDYVGAGYGKGKWSISADALVSYDADVCNYDKLMEFVLAKRLVKIISLSQLSTSTLADDTGVNEAGAKAQADLASKYYKGDAVIASVNKTAGDEDNASFSISLTGASALTPVSVTDTYLVTVFVADNITTPTFYGEWIFVTQLKKYVACDAVGIAKFLAPNATYDVVGSNDTENASGHATDVVVNGAPMPDVEIVIA